MLLEKGRIVVIESQGVWVETIQRSTCGSCQAQKGCGHSLLARFGTRAAYLWVLLEGHSPSDYRVGDEVSIGVPEEVITRGSLFVYILPLATMLAAVLIAHQQSLSDGLSALSALAGLLAGALMVRAGSYLIRFDSRLQPVLVDEETAVHLIETCAVES